MKPDDARLLQLDQQLCFPIYAASNLMLRLYRPLLDKLGLTYPQYLVMLVLWEQQPLSVGELGERLYLDSGTLTPMLKRMEKAGLVRRARAADDERRVEISLTDEGAALKREAYAVPTSLYCRTGVDAQCGVRMRDDLKNLIAVIEQALATPL